MTQFILRPPNLGIKHNLCIYEKTIDYRRSSKSLGSNDYHTPQLGQERIAQTRLAYPWRKQTLQMGVFEKHQRRFAYG